MNRLKRTFASILATLAILIGAVVVAPVATAAPAHAYTKSGCYSYYEYGWRYTQVCYYDYNWWEEVWGYHDGWYRVGTNSYTA
jgi:hypothetical protein